MGKDCVIMTIGGKNVMFGCGMHIGYKNEPHYPDFSVISLAGDFAHAIDCIIVTHLWESLYKFLIDFDKHDYNAV